MKYLLIGLLAVAAGLAGCERAPEIEHEALTQEDTFVDALEGVEILYSDSAIVRVRVTAPAMLNYADRENPRQEFAQGVKVEFLNPDTTVSSTLSAQKGVRYVERGLVVVRDSVVLVTSRQEMLETEELTWDEKAEKISTEKFVKVTKPGEVIYGYGLEANQDFSYWKITVPKGRIKLEPLDKALQ
jgi:LPS export ABC transporter protein LptC